MAEGERVILATLCLVCDGHRVLLQDRVKKDWPGLTLPGGHVEKGESFVEAVIREIKEETGLLIEHPQLRGIKQFPTDKGERYVVLLFQADTFSGELVSSPEGEMMWMEEWQIHNRPVASGFWDIMRVFSDRRLTELVYEQNSETEAWTARYL